MFRVRSGALFCLLHILHLLGTYTPSSALSFLYFSSALDPTWLHILLSVTTSCVSDPSFHSAFYSPCVSVLGFPESFSFLWAGQVPPLCFGGGKRESQIPCPMCLTVAVSDKPSSAGM